MCESDDLIGEERLCEDELNDWLATIPADGMISVSVDKWERNGSHRLTISLEYKMGDGCDRPYADEPPDKEIISNLCSLGWKIDVDGVMRYPQLFICPKCGVVRASECEEVDNNGHTEFLHKRCGSTICDFVSGAKWIYGSKTLVFNGDESTEQIKERIRQEIEKVQGNYQELSVKVKCPKHVTLETLPIILTKTEVKALRWFIAKCGRPEIEEGSTSKHFIWRYRGSPIFFQGTLSLELSSQETLFLDTNRNKSWKVVLN